MKKKKIINLIIGTNNPGKLREIKDLLPKNIKTYTPKNLKFKSPIENGNNFHENSLIKARFFSKKAKMTCLADDSGLEINILNNSPGIFSSRWAGKKGDFSLAINKIYKKLDKIDRKWKKKKIKARFVCVMTIYWPDGKSVSKSGSIKGIISSKKKGTNGFGYDPIFIPENKKITFGQMLLKKKLKIDHRYRAYKRIKKFL